MDVWSFACVIVEFLNGRPLFGGDSEASQLRLQAELIGPIPPAIVAAAPRRAVFFHMDGRPRTGPPRPKNERQTFKSVVHTEDSKLIDLLRKCLVWDQAARITAADALQHPFFEEQSQTLKTEQESDSPRRAKKSPAPNAQNGGLRRMSMPPKKGATQSPKKK
jgi:dual specificity tyrosine-phosphorylation-regulated kinase 2/3/4